MRESEGAALMVVTRPPIILPGVAVEMGDNTLPDGNRIAVDDVAGNIAKEEGTLLDTDVRLAHISCLVLCD